MTPCRRIERVQECCTPVGPGQAVFEHAQNRRSVARYAPGVTAPTLVLLAAGMGSRFGGPKQIAPIGPGGSALIDYAAHDAVAAGFGRLVLIVRGEIIERGGEPHAEPLAGRPPAGVRPPGPRAVGGGGHRRRAGQAPGDGPRPRRRRPVPRRAVRRGQRRRPLRRLGLQAPGRPPRRGRRPRPRRLPPGQHAARRPAGQPGPVPGRPRRPPDRHRRRRRPRRRRRADLAADRRLRRRRPSS